MRPQEVAVNKLRINLGQQTAQAGVLTNTGSSLCLYLFICRSLSLVIRDELDDCERLVAKQAVDVALMPPVSPIFYRLL